jgi:hypothetical protein
MRDREGEREELGRAGRGFGLPSPLSSSFLFLFYTQSIQTKLFEFKPYTLHTNKTNAPA